ncbi:MAG: hypothetical protein ACR2PR_07500 [Pseudohongiellaceae bacterium]
MSAEVLAMSGLRIISSVLRLQGEVEAATTIAKTLDLYKGGKNVDAHMQAIADKLEDGGSLDSWADINARVQSEVDAFLTDPA